MLARNRAHKLATTLSVAALTLCALPGAALAFEQGWTLRFGVVGVDSDLSYRTVDGSGNRTHATSDRAGGGVGVSAEYRFSPRLGIELGAMAAADVDVRFAYSGSPFASNTMGFTPITVGLNVHLTPPESKVDVYAGPLLAYVLYQNLSFSNFSWNWPLPAPQHVELAIDNDFAIGANLGLDIHFGKSRWMLCTSLKYLDTSVDARNLDGGRADVEFDPVIFSLGAGYRF